MPQVVEHAEAGDHAVQEAAGPHACDEFPTPPMLVPSQVPTHPAHCLVKLDEQAVHRPSVQLLQLQDGANT